MWEVCSTQSRPTSGSVSHDFDYECQQERGTQMKIKVVSKKREVILGPTTR